VIYRTLKARLPNTGARISDIFRCQLAELIWADARRQALANGETLRKFLGNQGWK
jgi:hypothetical protein